MFQQMRKLLAFGVNMILRPIGDFFGFLMRPVLIMLMRKLILPWYQRMMPTMIKMGDDIGKILALIPNWAIENLFSNMTFTPRDDDPLFGKQGAISKWAKELEDFDWGTTLTSNILGVTAFWSSIETFFKNVAGAINEKLYGYWNKYKSFIQDLGHIQNWIGWAWDKFVNFFRDTLGGIWDAIGGAWHKFVSFFQSIGGFASFAGITAANGYDGVVTRPTMMMVGERGAERVSVTPNGQSGGGGVTINIQNMVGSSGDIERLRSMILDVLQSSSSNRVRV
jgi:hypothetical protein